MKKIALNILKSADEKLRSFGVKHHNSKHSSSNTNNPGAQPVALKEPLPSQSTPQPVAVDTPARPPPEPPRPSKPSPHIPAQPSPQIPAPIEAPPPLPEPRAGGMAERRIQKSGRRGEPNTAEIDQTQENKAATKRRSRSEGPRGRRRIRNSIQEGTKQTDGFSRPHPSRFSMFTEPLSDDEISRDIAGSDSTDSDDRKQWTKNPLHVKRTKRVEKNGKQSSRKSVHGTENGFSQYDNIENETNLRCPARSKSPQGVSSKRNRESFVYQENGGNAVVSNLQKGKFQKLEERRNKRIDITVTSDEECTPQSRISRLRQRAILSSNLFAKKKPLEDNDILPQSSYRGIEQPDIPTEDIGRNLRLKSSGFHEEPCRFIPVYAQHESGSVKSGNSNTFVLPGNGKFYDEYTRQQGIAKSSQQVAPSRPNNVQGFHQSADTGSARGRMVELPQGGVVSYRNTFESKESASNKKEDISNKGKDNVSEVRMRSFREVRSNNPPKAVNKTELHRRYPNSDSSDDSLDDLIESNIQYLESEIESGRLKRQSSHYVNQKLDSKLTQTKSEPEECKPIASSSIQDELRFRLQVPSNASNQTARFRGDIMSQSVPNVTMVTSRQPTLSQSVYATTLSEESLSQGPGVRTHNPNSYSSPTQTTIPKVTCSPYVQRRSVVLPEMEDLSKSDSHLNASQTNDNLSVHSYGPRYTNVSRANNIIVSQPSQSLSLPSVEGGMFSDVEYDIEVSERVKKWEKLMKQKFDLNCADLQRTLNTIQESETSDSSHQNTQDKRQHFHQPSDHKVSTMSVNLTKSTSTGSQVRRTEQALLSYSEPRVVASETNLHRIFRVISERGPSGSVLPSDTSHVSGRSLSSGSVHPSEKGSETDLKRKSQHAQSLTNMKLSGNEEPLEAKQLIATDSDGGVRKSWRTSRYEEELSELKEIVSDSFQDLKKRFDSDASESEVKRSPSPVRQIPKYVKERWDKGPVFPQPFSVIETISPKVVSPLVTRKNESELFQRAIISLPIKSLSGSIPLSPTKKTLLSAMRSDFETPPMSLHQTKEEMANLNHFLSGLESKVKVKEKEVWSPHMESSKGLISIERMKARTLQTIPFSEDPVWKEIEEMTSFGKEALLADKFPPHKIDDLDALLQIATGSSESVLNSQGENVDSGSRDLRNLHMSNNESLKGETKGHTFRTRAFQTPNIQPLRLKIFTQQPPSTEKSSASALDEVLEDIRASLQRKPLSPKTKKSFGSPGSSPSLLSPDLKHYTKQFTEDSDSKPKISLASRVIAQKNNEQGAVYTGPSVLEESELTGQEKFEQQLKEAMQVPFIDPQYTQFPYLINGNYHLDPSLLKQKLISTGLTADSSDESVVSILNGSFAADQKIYTQCLDPSKDYPANQTRTLQIQQQSVSQTKPDASDLDQSVEDLKGLAREVEFKLSQIKSRIVKADEDRLDSILRALRKFAPTTEQKYFDVKFSPIDSGKAKKSKLSDALTELERIYDSLDLDDDSIIDGADRRDYVRSHNQSSSNIVNTGHKKDGFEHVHIDSSVRSKRSTTGFSEDIAEVERQTQGEFEDITKAFQVLLEEVTKQCKAVVTNASPYAVHAQAVSEQSKESQLPIKVKVQPQVNHQYLQNQSSYSVNKLGTVMTDLRKDKVGNQHGVPNRGQQHSINQSDAHVSFDKPIQLSSSSQTTLPDSSAQTAHAIDRAEHKVITQLPAHVNQSRKRIDKQPDAPTKLRAQPSSRTQSVVGRKVITDKVGSTISVDSAGLKHSGLGSTATQDAMDKGIQAEAEVVSNVKSEQNHLSRGAGRFQRRGNMEHRKSMPADVLKRSIETQTVETQTTFSPVRDQFDSRPKAENTGSSVAECSISSDSSPDVKVPRKRKISKGIASRIELFSSSDDERGRLSQLPRSQSAPSLIELIQDDQSDIKNSKVGKTSTKSSKRKSSTPRHIKQRNNESKIRQKPHITAKDDQEKGSESMTSSITSEDVQSPPFNKPPLYPFKFPKSEKDSPKRLERKYFNFDRDSDKAYGVGAERSYMSDGEIIKPRRKSEGCDNEREDECDRPRSFHELVAMFESNPDKLKKIKRLRKCASAESMVSYNIKQNTPGYFKTPLKVSYNIKQNTPGYFKTPLKVSYNIQQNTPGYFKTPLKVSYNIQQNTPGYFKTPLKMVVTVAILERFFVFTTNKQEVILMLNFHCVKSNDAVLTPCCAVLTPCCAVLTPAVLTPCCSDTSCSDTMLCCSDTMLF
ncbi:hypothetical protein ACJMK2_013258 [Sinanodonta woodiana]|uniref:Supervillin n=1 Tax=Sinanodonta woodiana TaxID=1069815 RepID=A0ABD3UWY4_SINWO